MLLALAAAFVLSGSAFAEKIHTVRQGQTLSAIAVKYGVSQKAILSSNRLSSAHKLKLGQKLRIPSAKAASAKNSVKTAAKSGPGRYVVRNGDHDVAISRRHGISVDQLHRLNPGVNWRALQIGQALRVPMGKASGNALARLAGVQVKAGGTYAVRSGDNDWIISRRVGTTPSKLRALNPKVKWTKLQIGQKLRVPGSSKSSAAVRLTSANSITTRYAKVKSANVSVRRGPSTNSAKVTTVNAGTAVTVLDRSSGWYKLRFPKGTVGWVRGDLLSPISTRSVAQARLASSRSRRTNTAKPSPKMMASLPAAAGGLLNTAYSMLGVRYRYGSMSRSATDCSGFTTQVFKAHGIKLPRTSREQSKHGASVAKSQLKQGDLVFFRTRGGSRVSHVGIYIGDGKFIHASSSGGSVRTDTLNSGYYDRRYAGARRVAKNLNSKEEQEVAKLQQEIDKIKAAEKKEEKVAEPIAAPVEPKDPTPVKTPDQGDGDKATGKDDKR